MSDETVDFHKTFLMKNKKPTFSTTEDYTKKILSHHF